MNAALPPLAQQVQQYLHDVLGAATGAPWPWPQVAELPYFLQDAFHWFEIDLFGHRVVLALDPGESKVALRDVRSKLEKARATSNQPILYVTGALASYERRHLIEQKSPFVVPGNQLYLPDLGIDLREYFRQRMPAPKSLTPAAQAVLITMLLQSERNEWRPNELARATGYHSMTLSRVSRELINGELVTLRGEGRVSHLSLSGPPAETWERAQPLFRSPIKRVTWATPLPHASHDLSQFPRAGASALAHYSMLSEPGSPVYAAGPEQWLTAGLSFLPDWSPGAIEWQAWSYQPPPFRDGAYVDPLSLTLSLRAEQDDRVQIALDEVKEEFPWLGD